MCVSWQANSHERYARAFVQQRVREVFEILDSKVPGYPQRVGVHASRRIPNGAANLGRCLQGDGQLDEEELLSHLWSVGYQATKVLIRTGPWERHGAREAAGRGVVAAPQPCSP